MSAIKDARPLSEGEVEALESYVERYDRNGTLDLTTHTKTGAKSKMSLESRARMALSATRRYARLRKITPELEERVDAILLQVRNELLMAVEKFDSMNSPHEGFAVLKEEVDELWEEVRKCQKFNNKDELRDEAIQCAAMSVRFILDTLPKESSND